MQFLFAVSLCLLGCAIQQAVADTKTNSPPHPQLQIVYNDKLREAMRRFNITETDMSEMLKNYVENGQSPTITKSVINQDTGLQETITLDFQGFTKEWSTAPKQGETSPKPDMAGNVRPSGEQRAQTNSQGLRIDDVDAESLQEQRKHLMRGMLTLDAESTDLKADFEVGRITEIVYRQRMLDNRQLYRDLMEQLIKVQSVLNDYKPSAKSTLETSMARRDSSRLVSTKLASEDDTSSVKQTREMPLNNEQSSRNAATVQQKLAELEELRRQNALLSSRIQEEQRRFSSANNEVSLDSNTISDASKVSDDGMLVRSADFRRQGPLRQEMAFDNMDQRQRVSSISAENLNNLVQGGEFRSTNALRDDRVLSMNSFPSPAADDRRTSSIQSRGNERERLLAEFQLLQNRKRTIYQILRQNGIV